MKNRETLIAVCSICGKACLNQNSHYHTASERIRIHGWQVHGRYIRPVIRYPVPDMNLLDIEESGIELEFLD